MTEREKAIEHCRRIVDAGGDPGILCHPDMEPGAVLMLPGLPVRTSHYLKEGDAYTADFSKMFPTDEEMRREMREWFRSNAAKCAMTVNVRA